jgi:hypothetical protein
MPREAVFTLERYYQRVRALFLTHSQAMRMHAAASACCDRAPSTKNSMPAGGMLLFHALRCRIPNLQASLHVV